MKLSILFFVVFSCSLFAQQHDNVWLLGRGDYNPKTPRLDFTDSSFVDSIPRNMPMWLSSVTMSDSLGNLLFYTNGIWIHNATHQLMQNGDSLNPGQIANDKRHKGYTVADGVLALPHPNKQNKYYLFHQSITYPSVAIGLGENLHYTLIDMNANSGLGRVEKKNQILVSDSICVGHLEVVKHGNGKDWWLIQALGGSNGFYTFLITGDTIVLTSKQYVGNNNRFAGWEVSGQAVFSPNGTKYVRYDYKNDLDIFDFDRCTGILSNPIHIPIQDSIDTNNPGTGAGTAISSSNQYLYISSQVYLYQFDLWAANIASSKDTVAIFDGFYPLSPVLSTFFGYLQLAPNNKIYGYANASNYLHIIASPDSGGISCNVQQHGLNIYYANGHFLPNFPHYRTPALTGSACDTLTSKAVIGIQEANIKIYPNPATTTITLESEQPMQRVAVYNALGQQIMNISTKQQQIIELETSGLENGSYFISIWIGNKIITKQFMVLR